MRAGVARGAAAVGLLIGVGADVGLGGDVAEVVVGDGDHVGAQAVGGALRALA